MKKTIRLLLPLLVLVLFVAAQGWSKGQVDKGTTGDGEWPTKTISLMGFQYGTEPIVEDILTPIWRKKTGILLDVVQRPADISPEQFIQMNLVADTLPDILIRFGASSDTEELLVQNDKIYEVTLDMLNSMTRSREYLEKLQTPWSMLYENQKTLRDGKLWYVPSGYYHWGESTAYEASPNFDPGSVYGYAINYGLWLRDDVLKEIFPDAMTEAELQKAWYESGGTLTWEDIDDIPIRNLDDLYAYGEEIAKRGIKHENGEPIIPFQMTRDPNIYAIWWSGGAGILGFGDWSWVGYNSVMRKGPNLYDMVEIPEFKQYVSFFNKGYNYGYIDPEAFIQKKDQLDAKILDGRYAVVDGFINMADARGFAREQGRDYGFRYIFAFMPNQLPETLETKYMDGRKYVSYDKARMGYTEVTITKNIEEEDMPQILNWIDWNMSEEAESLRVWGLPEFYTGDGLDRRFKPEYKDLEQWALFGSREGKDGWHYGMWDNYQHDNNRDDVANRWNPEVFTVKAPYLPYAPMYAYPEGIPEKVEPKNLAVKLMGNYVASLDLMIRYPRDPRVGEVWTGCKEYQDLRRSKGIHGQDGQDAIATAIHSPVEDFDENYAKYEEIINDPEWRAAFDILEERYAKVYWEVIKPARDKAEAEK